MCALVCLAPTKNNENFRSRFSVGPAGAFMDHKDSTCKQNPVHVSLFLHVPETQSFKAIMTLPPRGGTNYMYDESSLNLSSLF